MIPGLRMPRAEAGKGRGVLGGALFGLAMIAVALGLQFWNEGRAMRRTQVLDAAAAEVQPLATGQTAISLAHISARVESAEPVLDPDFGVQAQALALRRQVEMFQWVETRETRRERGADGVYREVEEYRYERTWDDDYVDSSQFKQPQGHSNPPPPAFSGGTYRSADVRLGGYPVHADIVWKIEGWQAVPVTPDDITPNLAASFRSVDGWLYSGDSLQSPALGDVRVRFEQLPEGPLSLIAALDEGWLTPAKLRSDDAFFLLERGEHPPESLIASARSSNSGLAWALRAGGFALLWLGFGLLLRPLVALAEWVPLLGRLVGGAAAAVSFAFAALFSLIAIGSGWLWYRPWWLFGGLALLVAAGVLLFRRSQSAPSGAATPPPPPTA